MRPAALTVAFAAVLLAAPSTFSDTLRLSNGGELTGTLTQLEFLTDGAAVKYARAAVQELALPAPGKDTLRLQGGTRLQGELVTLNFRSVGGELTFTRKDVAGLTLAEDPLVAARKELEAKKAALPPNDAKALYDLAAWCAEKGLKSEAAALARQCLTLDATTIFAPKAHELAGDVLYKDKWMTPAEMLKLKQEEGPADPGPRPPPKEKPKPEEKTGPPDGTYSTSAKGYKGPVTVAVKMVDGKIAGVRVTQHREDRPKNALIEIPSRIVAKQVTDVDVITGASFTSRAIMKAAQEAIAGATRKPAEGIPDGTYAGAARGYVADVKMAVRVKDGRFESVRVVSNRENRALTALTDVPQRMMEQQQVDVDTVSRATITSNAIIKAVKAALDDGRAKAHPAAPAE